MINKLNLSDNGLEKLKERQLCESYESTIYLVKIDNEIKVFKLFKNSNHINNKIAKLYFLEERLSNIKETPKIEHFVLNNNQIIGYIMSLIEGTDYNDLLFINKMKDITILKKVSETLNKLHKLNIVAADFENNILVDKNLNPFMIDIDNFMVDKLPVDTKNVFLKRYQIVTGKIDKDFDNYLLNMLTLSKITKINIAYLVNAYYRNPNIFRFKDTEIRDIAYKTLELHRDVPSELIIDKINSKKELKKIRRIIF